MTDKKFEFPSHYSKNDLENNPQTEEKQKLSEIEDLIGELNYLRGVLENVQFSEEVDVVLSDFHRYPDISGEKKPKFLDEIIDRMTKLELKAKVNLLLKSIGTNLKRLANIDLTKEMDFFQEKSEMIFLQIGEARELISGESAYFEDELKRIDGIEEFVKNKLVRASERAGIEELLKDGAGRAVFGNGVREKGLEEGELEPAGYGFPNVDS